jgi:hypothetical protein
MIGKTGYDNQGRVVANKIGPSEIEMQLSEELNWIDGVFDFDKFYVEGGIAKLIPLKPSDLHVFDYVIKGWVVKEDVAAAMQREQRDKLLTATDWTQGADVPQSTRNKWAAYRQALRDVPQQPGFPTEVIWPAKPAS